MKFTKTDNIRVYVSKDKKEYGRGDFYKTPKQEESVITIDEQVKTRIAEANNLYSVFFAANNTQNLEEHFKRLVSNVRHSKKQDVRQTLCDYKGYDSFDKKTSQEIFIKLDKFQYKVSGKKELKNVMKIHVCERMADTWQVESFKNSAVEILVCICAGRDYTNKVNDLSDDTIDAFKQACMACEMDQNNRYPIVYIESSRNLEKYFSILMKSMADECSADEIKAWQEENDEGKDRIINRLIQWLENCKTLNSGEKVNREKKPAIIQLSKIRYPFATEDRLQAVLVRMRKALKRGTNRETAILLMQGLAQMDGRTLHSVIEEMKNNPASNKKLKKFIDAVIKNYYRTDILKSIKRTNVKVQPDEISSKDDVLSLSNAGIEKKAALNETLIQYASSRESSDQTLSAIKEVLFSYFSIENGKEYLESGNIWRLPPSQAVFFDDAFIEPENDIDGRDPSRPLEDLWDEKKPNKRKIKNRILYVNYGKYKGFRNVAKNEFEEYWFKYIKEYVEKNYTGERKISVESCYSTSMLSSCWKDIISFICGKYIDIGKAVYHFAMPQDLNRQGDFYCGQILDEYKTGISSFDYEAIKAEETLQRDISVVTTAAIASFSNSVIDEEKRAGFIAAGNENLEDVLSIKDSKEKLDKDSEEPLLWDMTKPNAVKQLLRFYGGASTVEGIDPENEEIEKEFICEIKSHLNSIRNENFHYAAGKKAEVSVKYTRVLWENERKAYKDQIIHRYYSNNTGMFYSQENLIKLIERLYRFGDKQGRTVAEAQIPAFRKVWQIKDLRSEISAEVDNAQDTHGYCLQFLKGDGSKERQLIYENALYFLLKEIYYRDFILSPEAKKYFFGAADSYYEKNNNDRKYGRAVKNFNGFIKELKSTGRNLTFGGLCQAIMQEYDQQNTKKEDTAIFQHYKILFPIYVKEAFTLYLDDNYQFLKQPVYRELSGEQHYLDSATISCMKFPKGDIQSVIWYTFAHFIHPRQLNLLIGDFKSYIQFRQDIIRRMDCANALPVTNNEKRKMEEDVRRRTDQAKAVLDVLDFVRVTAGRVSNCFEDYYESEDAYADYLHQYVDFEIPSGVKSFDALKIFCQNTLSEDEDFDLYADEKNPKVLRNVEIARMYAGGDLPLAGRDSVSLEEIQDYYNKKPETDKILAKGLCKNSDEQDKVLAQQQRRNRLTLNDVTDIYALVSDLLGELISLAYLRERDQMYLLLGFYYMALQSADLWSEEELQSVELSNGNLKIKQGLVLYQVVSIYDYGMKLPHLNEKGKWERMGGQLSIKYKEFHNMHSVSMDCALRLFGQGTQLDSAVSIRNYVDHGKYYMDHSKSLVDLYNEFYTIFFGYSKKLRASVTHNFQTQLGRYFVEGELEYEKGTSGFSLGKLKSTEFVYKLQDGKTYNKNAKDVKFLDELRTVLEYAE